MEEIRLVNKIMSTNLVTVSSTDRLTKIEKQFKLNNIRHLPVINDNKIVGILSKNDLLKVNDNKSWEDYIGVDIALVNTITVNEVMTKNVTTINSKTTIKKAAKILSEQEFHALPVVDDGILVGVLTTTDLIKYLLKNVGF